MNGKVARKLKKASIELVDTQLDKDDKTYPFIQKTIYNKLKRAYTNGQLKFK
jgi:hypothetical protein